MQRNIKMKNENKISTLCIPHVDGKVLLGRKKRDFGVKKWNGFGGKIEKNETIEECAIRELREEAGINAKKIEKVGHNTFEYQGKNEIWEVHIFKILDFEGDLKESDETEPKWFLEKDIPFDEMWPDDMFWMPKFLKGEKFRGQFIFEGYEKIIKHLLEDE